MKSILVNKYLNWMTILRTIIKTDEHNAKIQEQAEEIKEFKVSVKKLEE